MSCLSDFMSCSVCGRLHVLRVTDCVVLQSLWQVTVAKRMEERKLKLPLLIGGATTSKMHTAVKLVTQYSGPVVHVLDASRSVPVAQTLLDKSRNTGFVDDIREVRYPSCTRYITLRNGLYGAGCFTVSACCPDASGQVLQHRLC